MKTRIQNCHRKIKPFLSGLKRYKKIVFHRVAMRQLYKRGKKIKKAGSETLFWVPGGMPLMLNVESAIAAALRLRGSGVHAVICDGVFVACVRREIKDKQPISRWQETCAACKRDCATVLEEMAIPYSFIGDYVPEQTAMELRKIAAGTTWGNLEGLFYGEINVGKNAKSAVLRYLHGHSFPSDLSIVREYAFSALVCAAAAENAIKQIAPARIMMSHGTYVDWGPALHTALARKIPVVAWMASYLPARFYFRHVEDGLHIDFHNISHAAWNERSCLALTGDQDKRLDRYLQNRYKQDVSFDMKRFKEYMGQTDRIRSRYGLDAARPVWGIMTHINWDTVSDYAPMIYESFNAWVIDTIHEIKNIDHVQWIIKVHPAEAWDNPDSGVECLINKHFPILPEHVRLLPADEDLSPLDFFQMIDGGITVYGTAGLESALQGKPVILAGEAHYGRKGFTYDAGSQASYRELLNKTSSLPPLNEEQRELARRYAYCYFIQRQIPISVVRDPQSKWWSFQFDKKDLLLEKRDPAIDFVCEKIMDEKDFIMDEQLLRLADENMDVRA
ncbi:MAG: capsular biosynthesis protein [Gallionellaceae bacterium]|jgi:hypothetical protein|nr:capsular biosynthesis protein [Gallionellaceae bacterium]